MGVYDYHRRQTLPVKVGVTEIGGNNPVRLQSMASRSTMATDECMEQCVRMVDAGAELVRFTAQGVREAENLAAIRKALRDRGVDTPLVADIHFNPRAAFAAAKNVEKVRINPGNFVDPGRTFRKIEFTDEEYATELRRIDDAFTPFIEECRANGTAIRIGVNHGSLSDRIMSRYGDTPEGMVESAMEFLRVAKKRNFSNIVISIKASNVVVMVSTVRLLAKAMEREGMNFPLHLGVTEAGDGEDGRVKSAVGIGTLLAEGLGDTIRVSLSEEPECELPVARELVDYVASFATAPATNGGVVDASVRSVAIGNIGGDNAPVVIGESADADYRCAELNVVEIDASQAAEKRAEIPDDAVIMLSSRQANRSAHLLAAITEMRAAGIDNPVIVNAIYDEPLSIAQLTVRAAVDLGRVMLSGHADGISITSPGISDDVLVRVAFGILQASRRRITKVEYIACPGCGRTLFSLQSTLKAVKEATAGLTGVKIGVMGCIVNGPGEMADADYGYVGAGKGRVSLYRGKECVEKNIPEQEAVSRLVDLIKADGRWK